MLENPIVNVIDDETKNRIIEACGEYIDLSPKFFGKGLMYGDLNVEHMFENLKKQSSYNLEFQQKDKKQIKYLEKRLEKHPDSVLLQRMLEWEQSKPDKTFINNRKAKRLYRKINDTRKICGNEYKTISQYGVCDTPEQILKLYDFDKDPRKLCITFAPIFKEDQPEWDGWRWHKWGPYIGSKKPQHEYLYHEEDIDMVLIYHIYELD